MTDWRGTHFASLVARLSKEMSRADLNRLYERDANEDGCVNCAYCQTNVPLIDSMLPFQRAYCYHHIDHRGMGGGAPNRLSNLVPVCPAHHLDGYDGLPELAQRVMLATRKASPDDYPDLDIVSVPLSPLVRECLGFFGEGTRVYRDGIPPLIQRIWTGTEDVRIVDFCVTVCQVREQCLKTTARRFWKSLKG